MVSDDPLTTPRILIIDDQKVVRDVISSYLKKDGYNNIYYAENGEEGVALLKEVSPVVVILDINMPVMDGIAFLENIQLKPSDPYIITVLTAHADNEIMEKCYALGANFFLRKPCNRVELRSVVKRSMEIKKAEEQLVQATKKRITLKQELAKKEMEEKLMQADKMVSLGTMAAGVAHDVNNPLSVAAGDVHLMKRDFSDIRNFIEQTLKALPPEKSKDIEKLKEEIDLSYIMGNFDKKLSRCEEAMGRIKDIVMNLKDFSRMDEREVVEIDIEKEIETSLDMIPKKYKGDIEIKKKFSSLPKIPCYGRQINQVFVNLMVNALQAMNGEGALTIETSSNEINIYIKICDTGPGIPEDKLKKIFNPFYTTKSVGEGTGLGLSICQSIIESHEGEISAENNPDKGVTFTIKLLKEGVKSI